MIYHLLYPLHTTISAFNVFRYITFRTIYASLTAFLICFIFGPWVIRKFKEMQIGQYIRDDGPQSHLKKAGTPTMGGLLIIGAVVISTLLWSNLKNGYVWIVLMVIISLITKPKPETTIKPLMFSKATFLLPKCDPKRPFWQSIWLWWAVFVVTYVIIYILLW